MLNDNQIKKAIDEGRIKIYYSFYKDSLGKIKYINEASFNDDPQYWSNLYSDRLKVTLGPIVKPLNRKRISKKNRFKDQTEFFDLRTASDKYLIEPGETIVILTNERIVLDGQHSVLIIPRVSLSEVGIVVTAAYIDPFYNGLLRLNVTNNSQSTHELKFLETIAQCFFFELPDKVNSTYKSEFSQKSVFVGQNWKSILEEDRTPFPVKKVEKQTNYIFDTLRYTSKVALEFINKNALLTTIIAALLLGWTGYMTFNDYKTNTEKIVSNFDPKTAEIIIDAGKLHGEREVTIECDKTEIVAVLCNYDGVTYKIFSGNKDGMANIVFSYELESANSSKCEIEFTYIVIRKV
ncbi:MAG: hypothetical protein IJ265_03130 [Oscillospiraceae bacterium]|nr:hypothetical protein [Oscillospiraceae bacterium]